MPEPKSHALPSDAGPAEIRTLLFRGHSVVRGRFDAVFSAETQECIEALADTYAKFRAFERIAPRTERTATVQLFLYTALNSLLTSLYLLMSGMLVPAGNMIRQYAEASAMALLCSSPHSLAFTRYQTEGTRYPVHNALKEVSKRTTRKALRIRLQFWESFIGLAKFYDQFSHPSLASVGMQRMFTQPGYLAILGEFDPGKAPIYSVEFANRRSAAVILDHFIDELAERLPFDPNQPIAVVG